MDVGAPPDLFPCTEEVSSPPKAWCPPLRGHHSGSQRRHPGLFAPWASVLLGLARPRPGERVLDLACGIGVFARAAVPMVSPSGWVTGLDLDPANVAVARAVGDRESRFVGWHVRRAERLPLRDAAIDLVVCQFGLMFFSDRPAAVREMHRVMSKGGRLVASTWQGLDRHPFHQAIHEATLARLGISTVASVFALGDADELGTLVHSAGFSDVRIEARSITARFANAQEFLAFELGVDPAVAPTLRHLDRRDQ
ncbi:class I SAM-dependent methyltransferase [Pedococcus bigeumensis]|uniref:Methyltransferase domain-containing protein n=1 Tax=Pedococcus bigeumensis TaxID=433644 RepID=A0A502CZ69_9MICO|nr:methyltransferase domain-containing protein [Pedococcus bigeumensis]TPG18198.1 methyltransferase domain-containing protein [Pedococcus bigeumensis]